ALLVDIDDLKAAPIRGTVLKVGLTWAIVFKELPVPDKDGTRYHLFVGQTDAQSGTGNLAASVEFTLLAPAHAKESGEKQPEKKDGSKGEIPVQSPQPDSV